MTRSDEPLFEPRIADWLEDDPYTAPDQALDIVLAALPSIKQRRAWRVPWRVPAMPNSLKLATAAVAVILAIGGAAWILGRGSGSGVGGPLATPTPAPSATRLPSPSPSIAPSPTASPISTSDWLPFTSSQYGYQAHYPPTWQVDVVATRQWDLATDRLAPPVDGMNGSADHFIGEGVGGTTAVTGLAADVPAGMSEEAWLAAYYGDAAFCPTVPTFVPITVDGNAGRLDTCYDAQAIVFVGNRVYVFAIHRTDNQPLFSAFLSTVTFPVSPPTGSASPSASPS
jgi:hypothetical protein